MLKSVALGKNKKKSFGFWHAFSPSLFYDLLWSLGYSVLSFAFFCLCYVSALFSALLRNCFLVRLVPIADYSIFGFSFSFSLNYFIKPLIVGLFELYNI